MKKIIAVLLIAALMVSMFAGCGKKEEAPAAQTRATTNGKAENSLTLAINATTSSLDPHHYTMNVEDQILSQIYEPLFFVDDNYEVVYQVASAVEIAEDGSSVTCTLRDGVTFASGDPVTVEDVVYSLSRCENSSLASYIYTYSTVEAVDEKTVKFSFPYAEAGAGFWELCPYFRNVFVVNESFCSQYTDDVNGDLGYNTDGTGAYMFKEIDNVGNITLVKNPTYWGEANVDTLKFVVNTGNISLAFQAGDVDYFTATASEYKDFESYANVGRSAQAVNNFGFLGMNCTENSAFNDINVRKAATLCLNREDIALVASDEGGTTAYNLATPLVAGYSDCTNHYDMNLDEANSLLSAAGYSADNKVNVTIIALGAYPEWVAACEIVKENLEQSYFNVTIEEVADQSRYFTFDFDMFIISIGLTATLSSYISLFDDASGLNLSGISGEEQAAVLATFDDLSSQEKLDACMNAMVDCLAYVPLYFSTLFNCYDADLTPAPYYTVSGVQCLKDYKWN